MEEKLVIRFHDSKAVEKIKKMRKSGINITQAVTEFILRYAIDEKKHN